MNYLKIIISLALPLAIGFIGSLFTSSSVNSWYLSINKPSFNPPNWIFAPVWTILFILIGISFYLVWQRNFGNNKKLLIGVFILNLLLNLIWSLLFFGLKNPFLAFIEIIILWLIILVNIIVFSKVSKLAGFLLIPYLLWVGFASALNYSIFILN